jgi:DNA-binding XRE family transcriptional regulator
MQDLTMTGVLPYFNNSQVKLATTLGVSRQAVNTWLKNDKIPPLRMYQIRDILKEIEMKIEMKIEDVSE